MGVALNVTGVPSQKGFDDDVIEIPGTKVLLTTILIGFDTTVELPVTQVALEVSWQVITSPFTGVIMKIVP